MDTGPTPDYASDGGHTFCTITGSIPCTSHAVAVLGVHEAHGKPNRRNLHDTPDLCGALREWPLRLHTRDQQQNERRIARMRFVLFGGTFLFVVMPMPPLEP